MQKGYRIAIVQRPTEWIPGSPADGPEVAPFVEEIDEDFSLVEAQGFVCAYNSNVLRNRCSDDWTWAVIIDLDEELAYAKKCARKCALFGVLERLLPKAPHFKRTRKKGTRAGSRNSRLAS